MSPVVGVSAFLVWYVGLSCGSFGFPLRVISCGLFPPSPRAPHYGVCSAIRSVSGVFLSGVWVCDLRIVMLVLESYCDVFCVVWFGSVLGADCSFRLSCCVPPCSSVPLTVELFPPTQSLVSPVVGVSAFLVRYVGLCCVSFGFPLRVIGCGLFLPSPRALRYGVCSVIRSVSGVFLSGVWVCDLRIVMLVLESYCDVFCVVWFGSVLGAD